MLATEPPSRGTVVVGAVITGVVGATTSFGTFVDVGWVKDGLIHCSSQVRRGKGQEQQQQNQRQGRGQGQGRALGLTTPRVLILGSSVHVRVLALDKERKRLSLELA